MSISKKNIAMAKRGKGISDLPTVLYSDAGRQIFSMIAQLNGSDPTQLALLSGIQPAKVSDLLRSMIGDGLVEKDEEEESKYGAGFAFHSLTPTGFRRAHELKMTGKKHFGSVDFVGNH